MSIKVYNEDCLNIKKHVEKETIDLVITSPPYNIGDCKSQYTHFEDKLPDDVYVRWVGKIFGNILPYIKVGGRLCLNLNQTFLVMPIVELLKKIGYIHRATIIWNKKNIPKRTAWGCYDEETRVLTYHGLKYFKDVDIENDLFATRNLETGELEYQKAFEAIEYNYDGDMYKLKSSTFDLLITPNHNVLHSIRKTQWENKQLIKQEHIEQLTQIENIESPNILIPQGHQGWKEGIYQEFFTLPPAIMGKRTKKIYKENNKPIKIKMKDWLKFLGIFFSDGNVYYNEKNRVYKASIYQKKPNFLKEIEDLLFNQLPFDFKYKESKIEYYNCSKQLASYLSQYKIKKERILPDFIQNLSIEQIEVFISWFFKGDGSYDKKGEKRYVAIQSPTMYNQMISLLLKCNYTFSTYMQRAKPHYLNGVLIKSNGPLYRIGIKKSKNYHLVRKDKSIVQYKGKVYCVSVPNKTLFIERHGKFTWCGNSWKSCSNPNILPPFEYIIVFNKDIPKHEGDKRDIDITKEEFITYTNCLWEFPAVRQTYKNCKAVFPNELPYRLMKLYSYRNDLILDPFMGTGTTLEVAKELDRRAIGFEITTEIYNEALQRLKIQ